MDGFIAYAKPSGISSNSALTRLKRALGADKAGFAGTLDPFASGVLPVGLGRATRLLEYIQRERKTYSAGLLLGKSTDTGDPDGEIGDIAALPAMREVDLTACVAKFTGDIEQVPPAYSALKIDGERSYKLARKGDSPTLKSRSVTVHSLEFLESVSAEKDKQLLERLTFRVTCSSGTYVRTLGEDIASFLGSVGHLTTLVREAVGSFKLEESWTLESIEQETGGGGAGFLLPLEAGLGELPKVLGSQELLEEICLGKKPLATNHRNNGLPEEGIEFAVMDDSRELAAICRREDNLIKPRKVFKPL